VLRGQGVEWAVGEQQRVALDPGLKALGGQDLGKALEIRAGRAGPGAQPAALAVGRLAKGVRERGSAFGPLDRDGQDVSGQVIAPRRQRDRELAGGPAVELGRAARARPGLAAEPPEFGLKQPFVAQPVQVELGGVQGHPDRGGGGLSADGVRLGGHVLVKGTAYRLGECPDDRGLRGEACPVLSKRRIV
jgi:hypothetical protein